MPRLSLWIICAGLVAVAVILMSSSDQPASVAQLPDALDDAPDLLMGNANILRYRPDGSLSYRLAARQMRHFDADNITQLDTAHLHLRDQPDQPPWDIHAGAGTITREPARSAEREPSADKEPSAVRAADGEEPSADKQPSADKEPSAAKKQPSAAKREVVFLHDDVKMTQENTDGSFIRLQTPSIFYYPDSQYAETSQNVMIDTDVGRTKAAGLQGELQQGLIRLFSSEATRVHTIVLRPQFR